MSTVILLRHLLLVAVAMQAFAGFGDTGIGLGNEANIDDVLTVLGGPMLGRGDGLGAAAHLAVSAASSTQTTILPTARGTLAMAVYGAVPARSPGCTRVYKTPSFRHASSWAPPRSASTWCSRCSARTPCSTRSPRWGSPWRSTTASPRSRASCTSAGRSSAAPATSSCAACSRCSAGSGWWALRAWPAIMLDPDYGYTTFGGIGGVFVIGVGMLALGVPLMVACAARLRPFFRGESLNADTPVLVPDTANRPAAGCDRTHLRRPAISGRARRERTDQIRAVAVRPLCEAYAADSAHGQSGGQAGQPVPGGAEIGPPADRALQIHPQPWGDRSEGGRPGSPPPPASRWAACRRVISVTSISSRARCRVGSPGWRRIGEMPADPAAPVLLRSPAPT